MQGWQIPAGGGRSVCLHAGKWDNSHGEGEWGAGSPSLDPSSGSRRTIALRMLGMGVRMLPGWDQQQAWLSPPSPRAAEALLGRGGCGRAGIVFLCHRKQLPGVYQAGSGVPASLVQPEPLSQPAGGICVQMLCRNGSVTWNISGLRAGFEPSPCPTPSA